MDKLFEQFLKLLKETDTSFFRYIYGEINWKSRMLGLTGPRGVGKTTMVLQHIKRFLNPFETLYVTSEDFYFADNRLIDLADAFVKRGGKYLFADEIHKYKDWAKELKLIYDYHSDEVGGKNKGLKQIQNIDKAYIVKDDIERGYLNTIPLWQFGLTY